MSSRATSAQANALAVAAPSHRACGLLNPHLTQAGEGGHMLCVCLAVLGMGKGQEQGKCKMTLGSHPSMLARHGGPSLHPLLDAHVPEYVHAPDSSSWASSPDGPVGRGLSDGTYACQVNRSATSCRIVHTNTTLPSFLPYSLRLDWHRHPCPHHMCLDHRMSLLHTATGPYADGCVFIP